MERSHPLRAWTMTLLAAALVGLPAGVAAEPEPELGGGVCPSWPCVGLPPGCVDHACVPIDPDDFVRLGCVGVACLPSLDDLGTLDPGRAVCNRAVCIDLGSVLERVPGTRCLVVVGCLPTNPIGPRTPVSPCGPGRALDELCPEGSATASCAAAGFAAAVVPNQRMATTLVLGSSRAAAWAPASGSGFAASADADAAGEGRVLGWAEARAVGSACLALAERNAYGTFGQASGSSEAEAVTLPGLGSVRALYASTAVRHGVPLAPAAQMMRLCSALEGCRDVAVPPNTAVALAPGVTLLLNEQGTAPHDGKTLQWSAALHLSVEPDAATGSADVYVGYVAALA